MPPKTAAGSKKTLYHSHLTKMGEVTVTVKSDILHSTYAGKPDYVILEIEGEDRYYNLDSDLCSTFFEGLKGRTLTIKAMGGKGAEEIEQRPAPQPRSAPAPARTPPPTRQAPPAGHAPPPAGNGSRPPAHAKPTPEQAVQAVLWAKCHSAQTATLQKISTAAVAVWADEWAAKYGKEMPADFFQAQVASNFIKVSRDIPLDVFRALPVDLNFGTLGKKANGTAPKPGHQPPPAPEPEPEPEAPEADLDVPF